MIAYKSPELLICGENDKTAVNTAMNGVMTLPLKSHFDHMIRLSLQHTVDILAQMPGWYNIQVDPESFLNSFSMCPEGSEEVIKPTPWNYAPRGHVRAAYTDPIFEETRQKQQELLDHCSKAIPLILPKVSKPSNKQKASDEPNEDVSSNEESEYEEASTSRKRAKTSKSTNSEKKTKKKMGKKGGKKTKAVDEDCELNVRKMDRKGKGKAVEY